MATRRILVTGCRGQLGTGLTELLKGEYAVRGVDIQDFDIREYDRVLGCLKEIKPEVVLHTAAYTDVDGCETNREAAISINAEGTENIARACREVKAKLIYYSTDYVFDGAKSTPYIESDTTNPQTHYGRSKLEGEEAVASLLDDYVILRIAWLYGRVGRNFVRTMVQLGFRQMQQSRQGEIITPLKVVDDQFGNPCWTLEIARQTRVILASDLTGVFHATSEGETSWYGFAHMIFEKLNMPVQVRPCPTEEFPRPAPRPKRSSLENKHLKETGLNVMRLWDIALAEFLDQRGESLKP
ncbi:MAG: dTDP-4-dehydrorhamnose reductase [Candidatus Zixiibacteriota bacterium]|nr:MAG: dTDP-4-dehydrorhamnose reductase [candidate division Zixibacteria bacterium]